MKRVRVKICGITNGQDALAAARSGVSALGFVFSKSPRKVTPERARSIIENIPPLLQTVGVFVDEPTEWIRDVADYCGLDMVQLHGRETPSACKSLAPRAVKAFRIQRPSDVHEISSYKGVVRGVLLDSRVRGAAGGTGRSFDWALALEARAYGIPLLLAGGLNPHNIRKALRMLNPFGVDVSSGVERAPGIKDEQLIRLFMKQVNDFETEDRGDA
jgi:phosphoribosylanthranilate isomerase